MRSRVPSLIVPLSILFGILVLQSCSGFGRQPPPVEPQPTATMKPEKTPTATPTPAVTTTRHIERTPKVKWSFDAGKNDLNNLVVGPDGTIYGASVSQVLAVSSKGPKSGRSIPEMKRIG